MRRVIETCRAKAWPAADENDESDPMCLDACQYRLKHAYRLLPDAAVVGSTNTESITEYACLSRREDLSQEANNRELAILR
jgi:hypothetical protein